MADKFPTPGPDEIAIFEATVPKLFSQFGRGMLRLRLQADEIKAGMILKISKDDFIIEIASITSPANSPTNLPENLSMNLSENVNLQYVKITEYTYLEIYFPFDNPSIFTAVVFNNINSTDKIAITNLGYHRFFHKGLLLKTFVDPFSNMAVMEKLDNAKPYLSNGLYRCEIYDITTAKLLGSKWIESTSKFWIINRCLIIQTFRLFIYPIDDLNDIVTVSTFANNVREQQKINDTFIIN